MDALSRRTLLKTMGGLGAALSLGACAETRPAPVAALPPAPALPGLTGYDAQRYALMYSPIPTERFPLPVVDLARIQPQFLRTNVAYATDKAPGTIVIDPAAHYLYAVEPFGRATRYGVGVGREGFGWSGVATINSKQEWPDWYPPKEMIERVPDLAAKLTTLQSGIGQPGGPTNPLGARALYLWQNGKDTLYRIHGTSQPWTIGTSVSSGCIRMISQDVIDLYDRTPIGTEVVVLGNAVPLTG